MTNKCWVNYRQSTSKNWVRAEVYCSRHRKGAGYSGWVADLNKSSFHNYDHHSDICWVDQLNPYEEEIAIHKSYFVARVKSWILRLRIAFT